MLLYYIRHGDPTYVPDALTPLGRRQAESVARRLAVYGLDAIYTSSSTRAMQTAEPTCELLKVQPTVLDWTNEGHAWQEMSAPDEDGKRRWISVCKKYRCMMISPEVRALGDQWRTYPGFSDTTLVQGYDRIERETYAFLSSLGYDYDPTTGGFHTSDASDERRIALFAHGGFGAAFLSCLLGVPYPAFSTHFDIVHTGVTVIRFDPKENPCIPKTCSFSNDGHLFRDGLTTNFNGKVRF